MIGSLFSFIAVPAGALIGYMRGQAAQGNAVEYVMGEGQWVIVKWNASGSNNSHPKDLSKSPAVAGFFVCGKMENFEYSALFGTRDIVLGNYAENGPKWILSNLW